MIKKIHEKYLAGCITAGLTSEDVAYRHPKVAAVVSRGIEVVGELGVTVSRLAVLSGLLAVGLSASDVAFAGSNVGTILSNITTNGLTPIVKTIIYGSYVGGVAFILNAINKGKKLSDGDQQTTGTQVAGWGLGGAALGSLGFVVDSMTGTLSNQDASATWGGRAAP